MWISAKFQLLLVKEFQRLKEKENNRNKPEWNLQHTLAKVNYRIHTDAIKENLIPKELNKQEINKQEINFIYASETGDGDYSKELLQRIRDIRATETSAHQLLLC